MKKLHFLLAALFLISFSGFAQKVKIKKEKALIDGVETYICKEERNMMSLSTLNDTEFVAVIYTDYNAPNPARQGPLGHRFPATIIQSVGTVKFLGSGRELTTDMDRKDIIKAIYNAKMVDADGNIDEKKLDIFITKYDNENLKYKLN